MLESITTPEVSNINETEVANKEQIDPSNEKKFLTYDYSSKYSEIRVPVLPSIDLKQLKESDVIKVQAVLRAYIARKKLADFQKIIHIRNKVAAEIVSSEETYVHNLRVLIGTYVNPLRSVASSMSPILTHDELNKIFSNVEGILSLSEELLNSLKERLKNWNTQQRIGDVFLKLVSFFKIYSHYCENYAKSIQFIKEKTKENPQFVKFLDTAYSVIEKEGVDESKGGKMDLTLSSFLIMPIQRIPRYILLLQEMKKYTWDYHPDFQNLTLALQKFTEVANHVNEMMRQADRMNHLLRIEQGFGFTLNLIDPARKFIREGILTKITSRFIVDTYFFLFNDVLIYAYGSHIRGMYTFKGKIVMGTTWIRDLPDTPVLKNAFQIVATKKTYTVAAATPQLKKEWLTDLNKVIEDLVAKDPTLIERRSTQIQTTKRGFFWSLFTVSPTQYDAAQKLQNEKEKERKILEEEQKNREEVLRSLTTTPRMRVFSLRPLDDETSGKTSTSDLSQESVHKYDRTTASTRTSPNSTQFASSTSVSVQTSKEPEQHSSPRQEQKTPKISTDHTPESIQSHINESIVSTDTQMKMPLLKEINREENVQEMVYSRIGESNQNQCCTCCSIV
jgi:hypothetical protein